MRQAEAILIFFLPNRSNQTRLLKPISNQLGGGGGGGGGERGPIDYFFQNDPTYNGFKFLRSPPPTIFLFKYGPPYTMCFWPHLEWFSEVPLWNTKLNITFSHFKCIYKISDSRILFPNFNMIPFLYFLEISNIYCIKKK